MRLPSQTSADPQEMLREIALQMTIDGPEQVILAEDYVNDRPASSRSNSHSSKRPPPPLRSITRLEKVVCRLCYVMKSFISSISLLFPLSLSEVYDFSTRNL